MVKRFFSVFVSCCVLMCSAFCFSVAAENPSTLPDTPIDGRDLRQGWNAYETINNITTDTLTVTLEPGASTVVLFSVRLEQYLDGYGLPLEEALWFSSPLSGSALVSQDYTIESVVTSMDGILWWVNGARFYFALPSTFNIELDQNYIIDINVRIANSSDETRTYTFLADTTNYIYRDYWCGVFFETDMVGYATSAGQAQIESSIQAQTAQQQENFDSTWEVGSSDVGQIGQAGQSGSSASDKVSALELADTISTGIFALFDADSLPAAEVTFPAFSIDVGGQSHDVWSDTSFDFSSLEENFGPLINAVRFATVALCYFALIKYLHKVYEDIFMGSVGGSD